MHIVKNSILWNCLQFYIQLLVHCIRSQIFVAEWPSGCSEGCVHLDLEKCSGGGLWLQCNVMQKSVIQSMRGEKESKSVYTKHVHLPTLFTNEHFMPETTFRINKYKWNTNTNKIQILPIHLPTLFAGVHLMHENSFHIEHLPAPLFHQAVLLSKTIWDALISSTLLNCHSLYLYLYMNLYLYLRLYSHIKWGIAVLYQPAVSFLKV